MTLNQFLVHFSRPFLDRNGKSFPHCLNCIGKNEKGISGLSDNGTNGALAIQKCAYRKIDHFLKESVII